MSFMINPHRFGSVGAPIEESPTSTKWRVQQLWSNQQYLGFAEIAMRGVSGGPNLCTGGAASSSSFFSSPTWLPANALDGNLATGFQSAADATRRQWWQYDFPAPVAIEEVAITSHNNETSGNVAPQAWILQYWDAVELQWKNKADFNYQAGWTNSLVRTYNTAFVPPVADSILDTRLYRLNITANGGDAQYTQIGDIFGYEEVGGPDILNNANKFGTTFTESTFYSSVQFAASEMFKNTSQPGLNRWMTNAVQTGWVRAQLPVAAEVTHIGVKVVGTEYTRGPKTWKLRYSDDGVAWSDALSVVNDPIATTQEETHYWKVPSGLGAHLYWEFNVTANHGDGYLAVGGVYLVTKDHGIIRNSENNAAFNRKSVFGNAYEPAPHILSRNPSTVWVNAGATVLPHHFTFLSPAKLKQFGIKSHTGTETRNPKDFTLEGYNFNTASWQTLATVVNQTAWGNYALRKFALA